MHAKYDPTSKGHLIQTLDIHFYYYEYIISVFHYVTRGHVMIML